MSLAKTAEETVTVPQVTITSSAPPTTAGYEWQGVPIDVLRTFNIELGTIPARELEKIKDITSWAKAKVGSEYTIGDLLQKISDVKTKLGSPNAGERQYDKVWEYIKSQRVIDEHLKRQQSLVAPRLI